MNKKKQRGFTLIEMLVVIAIIAILAGAVLLAINPAETMKKGRDSTRLSDMDTLRTAINMAMAEGEITLKAMGSAKNSGSGTQVADCSGYVECNKIGTSGLAKYIPVLPKDPINSGSYVYTFISTADDYELNAMLESTSNKGKVENDGGNSLTKFEVGTKLDLLN
ncbi:MAG TPA: prepilin-type N-terminal cleavage/methylation domain-containing protein [bacterium]|jgi:prepilin-type N-terminal cleavage/methylation domain-containing protein|nr:prepilin-type N-terminal cleavage/methylation domain-containing protein [bacterium]